MFNFFANYRERHAFPRQVPIIWAVACTTSNVKDCSRTVLVRSIRMIKCICKSSCRNHQLLRNTFHAPLFLQNSIVPNWVVLKSQGGQRGLLLLLCRFSFEHKPNLAGRGTRIQMLSSDLCTEKHAEKKTQKVVRVLIETYYRTSLKNG